ncbi:MAG: response regulator [Phycisphaera sp.]|nr:response regulator [Phycisphaera sp.]
MIGRHRKQVLVVDANPGDIRLIQTILGAPPKIPFTFKSDGRQVSQALDQLARSASLPPIDVHAVTSAEAALEYLHRKGDYAEAPRPDMIIMDLALPKMTGLELITSIKADKKLLNIPVVVFSGSDAPEDIREAYHRKANCYITKPNDVDEFAKAIKGLERFWMAVATLPAPSKD